MATQTHPKPLSNFSTDIFFYLGMTLLLVLSLLASTKLNPIEDQGLGKPVAVLNSNRGIRRHRGKLEWLPVDADAALYAHDLIYAPSQVTLNLTLSDQSKITLEPETLVELEEPTIGTLTLNLLHGEAKPTPTTSASPAKQPRLVVRHTAWAEEVQNIILQSDPLPAPLPSANDLVTQFQALNLTTQQALHAPPSLLKTESLSSDGQLNDLKYYSLQNLLPKNGAKFGKEWVQFAWDPIPLAGVSYQLQISPDASFSHFLSHSVATNRTKVQFPHTTNFYWRVKAKLNKSELISKAQTASCKPR